MKHLKTDRGVLQLEARNGRKTFIYNRPESAPAPSTMTAEIDGRDLGFPPEQSAEEKAAHIERIIFGPGGPREREPEGELAAPQAPDGEPEAEQEAPPHARETIPAPPEDAEPAPAAPEAANFWPPPTRPDTIAPPSRSPAKKKAARKGPRNRAFREK